MRTLLALLLTVSTCLGAGVGFNNPVPSLRFGLVGWWTFNEGTGTVANDYSGSGNPGTLGGGVNPVRTNGVIGNALWFNGTSSTVTLGTNQSLRTSVFTYAVFIKTFTVNAVILAPSASGGPEFVISGNYPVLNKKAIALIGYKGSIATNLWCHVAVTYDSSGNYVFYTNGVSAGSGTSLQTFTYSTFAVGLSSSSAGGSCIMDDLRMYNRALSADEVSQLYNGGYGAQ